MKIGLLMDAGWGFEVDAEIKAAVESAARAFEAAGAIVEPLKPFVTRAMAEGMDQFWRCRSWMWRLAAAATVCTPIAPTRTGAVNPCYLTFLVSLR